MSLLNLIPDPATFCVKDVKVMDYLYWRVLSLATTGLKIKILGEKDGLGPRFVIPTPEERARAAAVIKKALELEQAELVDDARAAAKSRDFKKAIQAKPLEEFVIVLEGMLRLQLRGGATEALREIVAEGSDDPVSQDAVKMLSDAETVIKETTPEQLKATLLGLREQIIAWHILRCYEADPEYVFTQEDWDRLVNGLDNDRREL